MQLYSPHPHMPAKPHFVGSKLTSKGTEERGKDLFYMLMHFPGFWLQRLNVILQIVPFYFISSIFFPHSIKMPQGPPGPLAVTFPDRLPYGESNVPDAFSCTRFPAAYWRGPLGLENEFHAQDTLHALLSSLTSKTAQSLQQTQEPPEIPMLSCQVQSPPAPRISRYRTKREGEDLRGRTDLRLTTSTGTEKRKTKQLDYQASQMWGVNWPLSKGKGKLVKKHRSHFIKIYFNCKRSRQKKLRQCSSVCLFSVYHHNINPPIEKVLWNSHTEYRPRDPALRKTHLQCLFHQG